MATLEISPTLNGTAAVSYRDIVLALRKLGINRSTRILTGIHSDQLPYVHGGAATFIGALLDVCGLLVMPTYTYQTLVTPEAGPPNNQITYGSGTKHNRHAQFWNGNLPADPNLGTLSEALRKLPTAVRSDHPVLSFTALGPEAEIVLAGQTLADPFAPIRWLSMRNGIALSVDTGSDNNPALAYASTRANQTQLLRWALLPNKIVEVPHWPGDTLSKVESLANIERVRKTARLKATQLETVPLCQLVFGAEDAFHSVRRSTEPLSV